MTKVLLFFLLIGWISSSSQLKHKRQATCDNCIPLESCIPLLDLLRSRTNEGRQTVRNAICGFLGKTASVCCPEINPLSTSSRTALLPSSCGNPFTADRIVGGEVAPIGLYPWMAILAYGYTGNSEVSFQCSGSIINERYILTAAHCVHPSNIRGLKLRHVRLGDWDLNSELDCERSFVGDVCAPPFITAGVEEAITHPMYDKRATTSDDIALIRLNTTLIFDDGDAWIHPVCLPQQGLSAELLSQGRPFVGAGWGITENGMQSQILLRILLPLKNKRECQNIYPTRFVDKQLCIGGVTGRDTCGGDSGGPIVLSGPDGPPFLQVGIVSYGSTPCGRANTAAAYTDVAQYIDWIKETMRP